MLLLCGDEKEIESAWVKNEWARFLDMRSGAGLVPICGNAHQAFTPTRLPAELQKFNAISFNENVLEKIDKKVSSYFEDRIKAREAEKQRKKEEKRQKEIEELREIAMSQTNGSQAQAATGATVQSLLKRAYTFLESGESGRAKEYFEKVLDNNAECAEAYLGELLLELGLKKEEELCSSKTQFTDKRNYQLAIKYAKVSQKEKYEQYAEKNLEYRKEILYARGVAFLKKGEYQKALEDFSSELLNGYKDSAEKAEECKKKIAEQAETKKKRKRRAIILSAATVVAMGAIATAFCLPTFKYEETADGVIITGYHDIFDKKSDLVIPETINGKTVVGISKYAFEGEKLTSVTLPNTVTYIGARAFYECSQLNSVSFGDSVTSIDDGAFESCNNLKEIVLPNSLTNIEGFAFCGCDSLTTVVIPDSVTTIGSQAFYSCDLLNSVVIGDAVTTIRGSAFSNCNNLTSVTFGDSVQYIASHAFAWSGLTSVVLPESVRTIEYGAFRECKKLTSVTIPDTVTYIEEGAIDGPIKTATIPLSALAEIKNAYLETVVITSGDTIEEHMFSDLENLTSVTLPDTITTIEGWSFTNCKNLTDIYFGNSLVTIGDYAFSGCENLKNITLPDTVEFVGGFQDCKLERITASAWVMRQIAGIDLKTAVITSGDTIEEDTFYNCSNLTSVILPDTITTIESSAFQGCSNLTSIDLPTGLTTIGSNAFDRCKSLTSIDVPYGVTAIENYTFYNCSNLTSVTLPDTVKSIGMDAFRECVGLQEIIIPSSVTIIHERAFNGCENLKKVVFLNNNTSFSTTAFAGCNVEYATLPLSAFGSIDGFAIFPMTDLKEIVVTSGEKIKEFTFASCHNLTSITLPDTITVIEKYAFCDNENLTEIIFKGTMVQWNAIEKDVTWNENLAATKVICLDGEVGI